MQRDRHTEGIHQFLILHTIFNIKPREIKILLTKIYYKKLLQEGYFTFNLNLSK